MAQMSGLGMEAEEIGMVALIGVILLPGVMWIANGKGAGSKLIRAAVIGAVVAGAVALESSLDNTAKTFEEAI